jgi:hypothetical protein
LDRRHVCAHLATGTLEGKSNDHFVKSLWFYSGIEQGLSAGETMPERIWFDFDVPRGIDEYWLAFGDVEPIRLTES